MATVLQHVQQVASNFSDIDDSVRRWIISVNAPEFSDLHYRNASKRMNNVWLALVMVTCLTGAQPSPGADKTKVIVDPSLSEHSTSKAIKAAWIGYGLARFIALEERARSHSRYMPPNDYSVELSARNTLAKIWRSARNEEGQVTDNYLDKLVEIADAGYMEEYVLNTFAAPGWTIRKQDMAAIDLDGFAAWSKQYLENIQTQTLAYAELPKNKINTDPPGSTLPDPNDYLPGKVPCAKVSSTLNKAAKQWEKEARSLPGTAITVTDHHELLAIIDWLVTNPPDGATSFTFVPSRVGELLFIAGYCGVDTQDYRSAERWLKIAIILMPLQTMNRHELAQVYIASQRFDEAEALVDEIFTLTKDRCNLGRAWRQRGFIRFEQGRLEESRTAYKQSLEYDPYSRIAYSELELLEIEIPRHGGKADPYQPPPSLPQTTTECSPLPVLSQPNIAYASSPP